MSASANAPPEAPAAAVAFAAEASPCPHCGGTTRVIPHDAFRWVCGACGGPRVPADDPRAIDARALRELRGADQDRKRAFTYRLAATGLGLTGSLTAGLGALLMGASVAVGVTVIIVALALLGGCIHAAVRARRAVTAAKTKAFEAWETVAATLVALHGGTLTAPDLAARMRTTEEDVERMMAFLSIDDRARIEVGHDAVIRYRVGDVVEADAEAQAKAHAAEAEAEADAAAEAEASVGPGATDAGSSGAREA